MQGHPARTESSAQTRGYLRDPSDPPLTEAEFATLCAEMIDDEKPDMFAVIEEFGECEDGRIAGWGLAFIHHVEVVSADGRLRARVESAAEAEQLFHRDDGTLGRLIWCDPELNL